MGIVAHHDDRTGTIGDIISVEKVFISFQKKIIKLT